MLGHRLKELRERNDLSVVDVAERLGVARNTAYSWETEKPGVRRPSPEQLGRLLDLYNATDDERAEVWKLRSVPRNEQHGEAA